MYHFPAVETAFITQPFGANPKAYERFGLKGHNGIDYGAPTESDIYACADGVVVLAEERDYGYGRHIRIQHKGFLALYGHLQFMNFKKGDRVKSGDVIGGMGGDPRDDVPYDGNSSGTHLHFEIRPDTEPANNGYAGAVDPMEFLLKEVPYFYEGRVITSRGLNVRAEPGTRGKVIGSMRLGEKFRAVETFVRDREIWLKLLSLREKWIAAIYYGATLAEYGEVEAEIEPEPTPEPPNARY
ncbi:MAG: M23 family metallopeptidase, partial [Euryarchaeota archaeon]|nr:M23 family metallopeptidase [Euryarchaeota archaeon]